MAERNFKHSAAATTLAIALASAAGCGGGAGANEAADRFMSEVSVSSLEIGSASSAETRHFDAYKQYRQLFDAN